MAPQAFIQPTPQVQAAGAPQEFIHPEMVRPNRKDATPNEDDEMLTDNFDYELEEKLDITCNVVFVLPIKYVIEVVEEEDEYLAKEMTSYKPL